MVLPEQLRQITTTEELDRAIDGSTDRPAVIFKHSPTCGISAMAFESILDLLDGQPTTADWFVVSVRASREVSRHASVRGGIRHESPQVMVFFEGKLVWHGSHYRATSTAIVAALEKIPAR